MKTHITIGLIFIATLILQTNIFAQNAATSAPNEKKRELVENLIATRDFLRFASNTQFGNETQQSAFKWAVGYYKNYKKAFDDLKTTLPPNVKAQLDKVNPIYEKVCNEQGFQYLSDMNMQTALAILGEKTNVITELMLK